MSAGRPLKPFPVFRSDEDAERFVETADLSGYDFSGFKPTHFEFAKKSAQINMRVPQALLDAVKTRAKDKGIPFTRYIRLLMEQDVSSRRPDEFAVPLDLSPRSQT